MDPIVTLHMVVQLALTDARRLGVVEPQLQRAEAVTWRSGALGCPQPGLAYTDALVPGFRVCIKVGEQLLRYHAGPDGRPRVCSADRAQQPLPDGRN